MNHIFIIEHLEPKLFPWCIIEYKNISKIVGKNHVYFTNIKKKDASKLTKYGKVFTESVKDLNLPSICILDPDAEDTLNPEDSDIQYFIFGGILGDHPPRKRTGPELTQFFPIAEKRNIGSVQYSTDNAVYCVDQIINKGKTMDQLPFQDEVTIQRTSTDSFILPFRYNLVNGKPFMSKELIEFLKKKKDF